MKDIAEDLSNLAHLLSQASAAVSVLEAIEEVLDELEDGDLSKEEALEEIQGLVAEYQALRELSEMSPEEILKLSEEEGLPS